MAQNRVIRFFNWKDYLQEGSHLAAAAALTIAVGYWVGPMAVLGCAAFAGALQLGGARLMDSMLGKFFVKHKINGNDAAGLDEAMEHFTAKAGLSEKPSLHDFEIDKSQLQSHKDPLTTPAQMRRILNAAAGGIKKPIIIISTPLLKALQPRETHAVIGHEFAHLGAGHIKLSALAGWLHLTTMFAAMFGFGAAVVAEGWLTAMLSFAGTIGVAYIGEKVMPKQEDRYTRDGTPRPDVQKTQFTVMATQEVISVGLLALPNPAVILTAFVIEHAFFWSSNLVNKSLSRRHEFQADRTAVEMGADPLALIGSLRKLERALELNEPALSRARDWRVGPWYERLVKMGISVLKTHPDTQRRCRHLADLAKEQGRDVAEIEHALNGPVDEAGLLLPVEIKGPEPESIWKPVPVTQKISPPDYRAPRSPETLKDVLWKDFDATNVHVRAMLQDVDDKLKAQATDDEWIDWDDAGLKDTNPEPKL